MIMIARINLINLLKEFLQIWSIRVLLSYAAKVLELPVPFPANLDIANPLHSTCFPPDGNRNPQFPFV
jgi:hypothetical protein